MAEEDRTIISDKKKVDSEQGAEETTNNNTTIQYNNSDQNGAHSMNETSRLAEISENKLESNNEEETTDNDVNKQLSVNREGVAVSTNDMQVFPSDITVSQTTSTSSDTPVSQTTSTSSDTPVSQTTSNTNTTNTDDSVHVHKQLQQERDQIKKELVDLTAKVIDKTVHYMYSTCTIHVPYCSV